VEAVRRAALAAFTYGSFPYGLIGERVFPEARGKKDDINYLYLNMLEQGSRTTFQEAALR
jgi:hypothetical protein